MEQRRQGGRKSIAGRQSIPLRSGAFSGDEENRPRGSRCGGRPACHMKSLHWAKVGLVNKTEREGEESHSGRDTGRDTERRGYEKLRENGSFKRTLLYEEDRMSAGAQVPSYLPPTALLPPFSDAHDVQFVMLRRQGLSR